MSDFVFISLLLGIYFPSIQGLTNAGINSSWLKGAKELIEEEIYGKAEKDGTLQLNIVDIIDFDINSLGYSNKALIESGKFSAKKGDIILIYGERT